jgi:hypothetical protein
VEFNLEHTMTTMALERFSREQILSPLDPKHKLLLHAHRRFVKLQPENIVQLDLLQLDLVKG